jgi:hypothetical protein
MNPKFVFRHEHVGSFASDGFHLNVIVVPVMGADHEVDAVIVNLTGEHITTMQDELHFDEIFGISPKLVDVESFPIVSLILIHVVPLWL